MSQLGTKKVRIGSVSLLFTVILLCVVVLSILSISTVRADRSLSERTADSVSDWYELQNKGQNLLSEVDAVLREHQWEASDRYLPEGTQRMGDSITAVVQHEGHTLDINLQRPEGNAKNVRYRIVRWKASVDWEEDQSLNLFH